MASIKITSMRKEFPGKSDKEVASEYAKKWGILIIVRYKIYSDGKFTNVGLCKSEEEVDNYFNSPACVDTEILFDGRNENDGYLYKIFEGNALNMARFLTKGVDEPTYRAKINAFNDRREKMEFISNGGYELSAKGLEDVAYELMSRAPIDKKDEYFWWWNDGHGHKDPWCGSYYDDSYYLQKNEPKNDTQTLEFFQAIKNGEIDTVSRLIQEGVDLNVVSDSGDWPPLFYAIFDNNKEIVEMLLNAGANKQVDIGGETPLSMAVEKGHVEIADIIKKHIERKKTCAKEEVHKKEKNKLNRSKKWWQF